jgi:hypothetical protein
MTAQNPQTKIAVSVSEMARMVNLSRARFYQLVDAGTFPRPTYDAETGRPYYSEEQQAICLDVRRRNCGIDGKPVLFYARRFEIRPAAHRPRTPTAARPQADKHEDHADLLDAVKALGLATATAARIEAAVAEVFPQGVAGIDRGEVVRKVFLHYQVSGPDR